MTFPSVHERNSINDVAKIASLIATAAFLISGGAYAQAPEYSVTDLGTLGGPANYSYATAVNNLGQVTGYSYTATPNVVRAFLYSGGVMTDIGTLPNPYDSNHFSSVTQAFSINDSGQIVGQGYTNFGGQHAFLYSGGTMTDLNPLLPNSNGSIGHAINNSGAVTGSWGPPNAPKASAFLYSGGSMTDLGNRLIGYAINNLNQVAGSIDVADPHFGHPEAALLLGNGSANDLGTFGYASSQAFGINNAGQVIGGAYTNSANGNAFLYSNGHVTLLGTLGGGTSTAFSINNLGQIVGNSAFDSAGDNHGFLYAGGTMYDLNNLVSPSAGVLNIVVDGQAGNAINDLGQIAAEGIVGGYEHALLLTPEVVPEPATWSAGFLTAGALLCSIWRRRAGSVKLRP